jgi:hypothetical protein
MSGLPLPCRFFKMNDAERAAALRRMVRAGGYSRMADINDSRYKTGNPIADALRFLCDASYAVLPRDAAHQLGEFEKNLWGGLRWCAERGVERIDESLAAADRLRDEWRKCRTAGPAPEPMTSTPPPDGMG